ncbi:MAG: hypothetical protein GY917_12905 [Planctomycetaceae bacterium]|nr:hypothetical protein [Planctomycetaceae bacterium]
MKHYRVGNVDVLAHLVVAVGLGVLDAVQSGSETDRNSSSAPSENDGKASAEQGMNSHKSNGRFLWPKKPV